MGPSIRRSRKELGGYYQHAQIAAAYEDCRQTFDQLSLLLEANRPVWEGNADFLESFKNSLVHWANVHHAENGSLDHALRKSSDLRDQVVDLLENLNQKLQNGKSH
ncbi:uncharacterized protein Z520_01343 [Fonsecaea multimorphosa CBS 102226]|uniref:Uncharacterized protein n=1 Tax=Fonsecaea multimorphosa CBS 102226 TaxID=1442371 RepID=A0A0D2KA23_9EURO|nr:uncharacterized protein Z520_01343 [Fonsecaea multimorphosa CBS 102226]KIY02878.1 hypothetical protein Z520_01343 [Fonsecaea multimorphosa CBS 102226]